MGTRTCASSIGKNSDFMAARVSSVFVLLVLSAAGSFLPLLAIKYRYLGIPKSVIFVTKYFGSGVIIATAYIHLLGESETSLTSPCLDGEWEHYSFSSALALAGTLTMFLIELFVHRAVDKKMQLGLTHLDHGHTLEHPDKSDTECHIVSNVSGDSQAISPNPSVPNVLTHSEDVFKTLVNIYLLEFGIVFHSVFVGLSLAISGEQFTTLFVAISFHQFFEGLGLGSRFATAAWPEGLERMPWYLSAVYSVTTPVGIAVGLGVRHLYSENSPISLIIVGVFDGFCSGLLIYNSLIELLARDFFVDPVMRNCSNRRLAVALTLFMVGAFLMALVGKWA